MKKLILTEEIDLDYDSLFNTDIDSIINYLEKIKSLYPSRELNIEEKWSGYEDNYFVVTYEREETDSEYECRIQKEKEAEERERKRMEREIERKRISDEINELKDKLNSF